jgi:putative colanic acid biosysnthesis UDP-glucose lipid carrier transferase
MNNQLLKNYDEDPCLENTYQPSLTLNKNQLYFKPSITTSPLFKKNNLFLKRIFDIITALAAITFLLWWVLPLIALFIKIDSRGPIFFVQKRNKKGGRTFHCFKLRTMKMNEDGDELTVVLDDTRITRLGKFLRKSHLDELPQFINVLMGDMSVVGPRPHMVTENIRFNKILNFYDDRHFVKPGITGLAQSFGYHGPVTDLVHLNKKIGYDIFYIQNWSPVMDVKIVVRTISMIFKKLKTKP